MTSFRSGILMVGLPCRIAYHLLQSLKQRHHLLLRSFMDSYSTARPAAIISRHQLKSTTTHLSSLDIKGRNRHHGEGAGMDAQVNKSLGLVESRLAALLEAFISSPTAARAPGAALDLLNADEVLTRDLNAFQQHQVNFSRICELRDEARGLEERVKSTVQGIVDLGDEITNVARLENYDATDTEDEDDKDKHTNSMHSVYSNKKVDYHVLLSMARRISRHDEMRASKPSNDIPASLKSAHTNGHFTFTNIAVDSLPLETRHWLLENEARLYQAAKIPFPTEEKIRMGVMGSSQSAYVEGTGPDPDQKAEQLTRDYAKGLQPEYPDGSPAHGLEHDIGFGYEARPGADLGGGGNPKPAVFDLDVYDPNEDEEEEE